MKFLEYLVTRSVVLVYVAVLFNWSYAERVIELTERFLEVKDKAPWLVQFYAPWCGHCKRLEPIFAHVAQGLTGTEVRVGKIDCTRFPSVASEFGVKGYPTILFFRGEEVFTFSGDRSKEEILEFSRRLSGPKVRSMTTCEDFRNFVNEQSVVVTFVGDERSGPLWIAFDEIAEEMQDLVYFFQIHPDCIRIPRELGGQPPSVTIVKEGVMSTSFHPPVHLKDVGSETQEKLTEELRNWVHKERFPDFVKVTYGNLGHLLKGEKLLMLAVLHYRTMDFLPASHEEFRETMRAVMRSYHKKHGESMAREVQFGWTGTPDVGNSIAMQWLDLPALLAVNTSNYEYCWPPEGAVQKGSQEELLQFVEDAAAQRLPRYGGLSWILTLRRALFEARSSLYQMWHGNPVLTTVLFGLPMGFLSLICYSMWCTDIMDAADSDEEEDEDDKSEKQKKDD